MRMISSLTRHNASLYMLLAVLLIAAGCAAPRMPLRTAESVVEIQKESIVIFRLKTSNVYRRSYQPNVSEVKVVNIDKPETRRFRVEKPFNKERHEYNEYLISLNLPPGHYNAADVLGWSGIPGLVHGSFAFPIDAEFDLKSSEIIYIGYVEMVNRKKQKGEPSSGGPFPLVDQLATGYLSGTFDVTITDNYEEDTRIFKEHFPNLNGIAINRNIASKTVVSDVKASGDSSKQ